MLHNAKAICTSCNYSNVVLSKKYFFVVFCFKTRVKHAKNVLISVHFKLQYLNYYL